MKCTLPLRVEHSETEGAHFLHAYRDGDPNQAGVISWSKKHGGQVADIEVREEYRRQGIATLLWEAALACDYEPPIRMTSHRTELGEAWVRSLGGWPERQPWDGPDDYWEVA